MGIGIEGTGKADGAQDKRAPRSAADTGHTKLSSLAGAITGVLSIDEKREVARQVIAVLIVGTLFLIVILSFVTLWLNTSHAFADLKGLLDVLVAPIIGIVGAVTGFYFGASSNNGRR